MLTTKSPSFSSSENVFISPLFLEDTFAGYRIWIDSSFLSTPKKCFSTSFCPSCFLMRNPLSSELLFLHRQDVAFLSLLSWYFSGSLIFRCFIVMSLGVDFFGYILFGVFFKILTLEVYIFLGQIWEIFSIISLCTFTPHSLSFWILRIQMLDLSLLFT